MGGRPAPPLHSGPPCPPPPSLPWPQLQEARQSEQQRVMEQLRQYTAFFGPTLDDHFRCYKPGTGTAACSQPPPVHTRLATETAAFSPLKGGNVVRQCELVDVSLGDSGGSPLPLSRPKRWSRSMRRRESATSARTWRNAQQCASSGSCRRTPPAYPVSHHRHQCTPLLGRTETFLSHICPMCQSARSPTNGRPAHRWPAPRSRGCSRRWSCRRRRPCQARGASRSTTLAPGPPLPTPCARSTRASLARPASVQQTCHARAAAGWTISVPCKSRTVHHSLCEHDGTPRPEITSSCFPSILAIPQASCLSHPA